MVKPYETYEERVRNIIGSIKYVLDISRKISGCVDSREYFSLVSYLQTGNALEKAYESIDRLIGLSNIVDDTLSETDEVIQDKFYTTIGREKDKSRQ